MQCHSHTVHMQAYIDAWPWFMFMCVLPRDARFWCMVHETREVWLFHMGAPYIVLTTHRRTHAEDEEHETRVSAVVVVESWSFFPLALVSYKVNQSLNMCDKGFKYRREVGSSGLLKMCYIILIWVNLWDAPQQKCTWLFEPSLSGRKLVMVIEIIPCKWVYPD